MTHSGGQQHPVGDRGQRYEVSYFCPTANTRKVMGWSETPEGAQQMADAIEAHPSWQFAQITDRQVKT